jgi:hypothetical protein
MRPCFAGIGARISTISCLEVVKKRLHPNVLAIALAKDAPSS